MTERKAISGKKKEVGPERRRYVRLSPPKPIQVKYRFVDDDSDPGVSSESSLSRSVGGGGLFLELPDLEPGTIEKLLKGEKKLSLAIDVPNVPKPIKALAKVIWMEGRQEGERHFYGVGVSFIRIDEDDRHEILNYIIESSLQQKKDSK